MKVFSREKWENTSRMYKFSKELLKRLPEEHKWWNICDGKTIEECEKMGFQIDEDWCIEEGKEMSVKDFIEKKIAIAFTSPEQIKEFAKMCEGYDMKACGDNSNAIEWLLDASELLFKLCRGRNTIIHLAYNFKGRGIDHGLSWSGNDTIDDKHYTNVGWKIVTFEEFKRKNPSTKYQIIIECDGNDVTTADMIVNGKIVKSAKAKRNPEDRFNFATGARFAFDRLFENKS